jgi:hypothetical protein
MKRLKANSSIFQKGPIILLIVPFFAMAQGDTFSDNTSDETSPSPIDNYLLVAMLIGIYFAYRFLKSKFQIKAKV